MVNCDYYESPLGTLWLNGRDGILTVLSFEPPSCEIAPGTFEDVKHWLDDYFHGIPREIDFPIEPSGTTFQKLIWDLLLKIPFGQTYTYSQLAKHTAQLMGREKMSPQAVGQAVGRNPIAIIIPCHRVIGTGGALTGYAYGIERKQWLLDHEQNRR